jgi:hypothetical protein
MGVAALRDRYRLTDGTAQNCADLHSCPRSAASGGNAASIQRASNRAVGCSPGGPDFSNDGRDVRSETISIGLDAGDGALPYIVEVGISEHNATSFSGLNASLDDDPVASDEYWDGNSI